MDCYIVRVYRHFTRKDGTEEEIAGLVERVGKQDSGKPFTSYRGLINAMRDEHQSDAAEDCEKDDRTEAFTPVIGSVRGS